MERFNETFADLTRQHKLLDDMRTNLNTIRTRCIDMYTSLWSMNRSIPWLGRTVVHHRTFLATHIQDRGD